MVFTMPQFIFSFFSMGSGQSVYLSWSITLYNMVFTLLPVLIIAVFENDVYI
jgi:phospholipid-transporting ATPase